MKLINNRYYLIDGVLTLYIDKHLLSVSEGKIRYAPAEALNPDAVIQETRIDCHITYAHEKALKDSTFYYSRRVDKHGIYMKEQDHGSFYYIQDGKLLDIPIIYIIQGEIMEITKNNQIIN